MITDKRYWLIVYRHKRGSARYETLSDKTYNYCIDIHPLDWISEKLNKNKSRYEDHLLLWFTEITKEQARKYKNAETA